MQPKTAEEEEADSAKKIKRRMARANKQSSKQALQTPPPQQRPDYLSTFFVGDTQPRLDLVSPTTLPSVINCFVAFGQFVKNLGWLASSNSFTFSIL